MESDVKSTMPVLHSSREQCCPSYIGFGEHTAPYNYIRFTSFSFADDSDFLQILQHGIPYN